MKVPQYDIFSGIFDEDAKWLEAVDGARNALDRMKLFAARKPGPYFIFCQEKNRVMASVDTTSPRESKHTRSA